MLKSNQEKKSSKVPEYLENLGIKPGEWMYMTKPLLDAMIRPNWPMKVRIWACIVRQTLGFGTDLAVTQTKGDFVGATPKIKALTVSNIIAILYKHAIDSFKSAGIELSDEQRKALRIDKSNVRRCLSDMEENDGLIMRVVASGGVGALKNLGLNSSLRRLLVIPLKDFSKEERERLGKGNKTGSLVLIYLNPRPSAPTEDALREALPDLTGVKNDPCFGPASRLVYGFLKSARIQIDTAILLALPEVTERTEQYHHTIEQAKTEIREFVISRASALLAEQEGQAPAPEVAPQEPATPKQHRAEAPGSANSSAPVSHTPAAKAAVNPNVAKTSAPPAPFPSTAAPESLVSQPRKRPVARAKAAEDLQPIYTAWKDAEAPAMSDVKTLFAACQANTEDCTPEEVAHFVTQTIRKSRNVKNWCKYFEVAVPPRFEHPTIDDWRAQQAAASAEAARVADDRAVVEAPEDMTGVWGDIKQALRGQLSEAGYENWLKATREAGHSGADLLIAVPDAETLSWLETEYAIQIDAEARRRGLNVRYEVEKRRERRRA